MMKCPFCGHQPWEDNLIDSLHPTGSYWSWIDENDHNQGRHYWNPRLYNKERGDPTLPIIGGSVWTFGCLESEGGCGASISGDSREEVITKWNFRKVSNEN